MSLAHAVSVTFSASSIHAKRMRDLDLMLSRFLVSPENEYSIRPSLVRTNVSPISKCPSSHGSERIAALTSSIEESASEFIHCRPQRIIPSRPALDHI